MVGDWKFTVPHSLSWGCVTQTANPLVDVLASNGWWLWLGGLQWLQLGGAARHGVEWLKRWKDLDAVLL